MTDRDAAPVAVEGSDTWAAACEFVEILHAKWESDSNLVTIGMTIEFVLRELRAARPALAAAPADETLEFNASPSVHGEGVVVGRRASPDLVIHDEDRAPAAAPREGGEEEVLLLELAHLAAEQFAALVIRNFSGIALMIPPRLVDALLVIAARGTARGEGEAHA